MLALRELQAAFRGVLLDARDGEPVGPMGAEILADGLSAESRLAVYRHHVLATLTSVLNEAYPVVARLVGEDFFAYAADAFVRRHPPGTPCLFEYGAGFADFVAAFPPCRDLAYLPDVARLEWAMHAALHAEDTRAADLDGLREISPDALGGVTLRVDPSLTLVSSPWPVDVIWRANQPGADSNATIDLGTGGVRIEIRRLGADVVWRTLPGPDHAFRAALASGRALEASADAALALDADFDLTRALATLFDEGLVVGVEVSP
jgi:hypothetical protein